MYFKDFVKCTFLYVKANSKEIFEEIYFSENADTSIFVLDFQLIISQKCVASSLFGFNSPY